MKKWVKKKLHFRDDIEQLKGKYIDKRLTPEEQHRLFFNEREFFPIVDSDKRWVGSKNVIRMLVRAFQRYNFYCSENKISQKENDPTKLCEEDRHIIEKYFHGSKFRPQLKLEDQIMMGSTKPPKITHENVFYQFSN